MVTPSATDGASSTAFETPATQLRILRRQKRDAQTSGRAPQKEQEEQEGNAKTEVSGLGGLLQERTATGALNAKL